MTAPDATPPRHIAVIMDGNGRWAVERHLPRVAGHSRGVEAARATIEACVERGIEYLTLFAFSSENWRRPADEVSVLMRLFVAALQREIDRLNEAGVRLRVAGNLAAFDGELRTLIETAERRTAANRRLNLTICASYGGRWDIVQAVQRLCAEAAAGEAVVVDEAGITARLALSFAPDPDLLIRTGAERRISNFLLWQLAYAELYFADVLWPDFDREDLDQALRWYAQRERRYGRTSAQVKRPA
ncbi:MAG TPA: polyprenyl diphosphate synthase [Burkholderiaceae bacterium]|nr:polyprenyl diphosphate synthase [Burkholderiaceae bacterium]